MKERSQASLEYLLMLALALTITSLAIMLTFDIFENISESIQGQINEAEAGFVDSLTR
ncbi:MAG: hypothetical protein ACLFUR_01680 [Candidatus Hadarchaeia archaeon]